MQLEGVCTIPMGGIFIQIFWQIDDLNSLKWAFLHPKIQNISSSHPVCQTIATQNNEKQALGNEP